jgi:hypothetical protein
MRGYNGAKDLPKIIKGEIKKQVNKPMALIKRDLNFLFTQLLF